MISTGHRWPDIQSYTLNQVGIFVKESAKNREITRKNQLYTTWMGVNADSKTLLSLLKEPARTTKDKQAAVQAEWSRLARALRGLT